MGKRKVAIVGIAESDFGTVPNRTALELHAQAASRALEDCGLAKSDIDGLFSARSVSLHGCELPEYLGLNPNCIDTTSVGGSTWEIYVEHAIAAIEAGLCTTALLVYGSTAKSDARRGKRFGPDLSSGGTQQFEVPFGPTLVSKYALAARRHMHQYGTTPEQLAQIAVDTRTNASRNPKAVMREPITIRDVLASKRIADPLGVLDCCLVTDGGGAIILTSAEIARNCRKKPVWVIGAGSASSHLSMAQMQDLTVLPAREAGAIAFGKAGIIPDDVDTLQAYDSFTITVLLTLEALGFCKPGEGGAFVQDGKLAWNGALPTNTDGGGLSSNHPGMRGLFLLIEAVRQLRGESTAQVPDAKIAVCNGTGGFLSHCGTVVLARD